MKVANDLGSDQTALPRTFDTKRGSQQTRTAFLLQEVSQLREAPSEPISKHYKKYKNDLCGRIASNHYFELYTFFMIALNSLYIGYDADYTAKYGKPDDLYSAAMPWGFIVAENVFAIYFTFEVVLRLLAYKNKCHCFCDAWFVFDSILVTFMVVETWIFPIFGLTGPLAQFSVLRLLRLLRISRMARLMRTVPELMIIIKGLFASVRSVGCTAVLLILCLYVWSILFVTEYHEGARSEDELADTIHYHFGTLGRSMFTLFIMGTILDDVTVATNAIRGTHNVFMLLLFILFILLSSFTILNMLIGILCQVVSATAVGESAKAAQTSLRDSIRNLFSTLDKDNSGCITREEFLHMRDDRDVSRALKEMDISAVHFHKYCEILFHRGESSIDYDTLIKIILRLRPGNCISALDLRLMEGAFNRGQNQLRDRLHRIREMVADALDAAGSQRQCRRAEEDHGCAVASLAEARTVAKGEAPPLPPTHQESNEQYPLEMFVKISSEQIIEEIERRLGASPTADTASPRILRWRSLTSPPYY